MAFIFVEAANIFIYAARKIMFKVEGGRWKVGVQNCNFCLLAGYIHSCFVVKDFWMN
jgi:hypothetical protein